MEEKYNASGYVTDLVCIATALEKNGFDTERDIVKKIRFEGQKLSTTGGGENLFSSLKIWPSEAKKVYQALLSIQKKEQHDIKSGEQRETKKYGGFRIEEEQGMEYLLDAWETATRDLLRRQ